MTEPLPSSRNASRIAKPFLAVAVLLLAAGGLWYWRIHSFHLREVVPGEIYRASQPTADAISRAAATKGIKTIVNLRGPNPKHEWYREESAETSKLGLRLVNLRFETFDWPPRVETIILVDAIDRAPRPLLLHCHSGLDRSGWAAGLVHLLRGGSIDSARAELSRTKGHFCDRKSCVLHRFFDLYEGWLAKHHRENSPEAFREWLRGAYYPPPYAARITSSGEIPRTVAPAARVSFPVAVANISDAEWSAPDDRQRGIRLGARILGPFEREPADPVELFRQPHTPARDLFRDGQSSGAWAPGTSKTIAVGFTAPEEPGVYYVQVDMVDEMVHWFSDLGDVGLILPLRVEQQNQN